MRADVVAKVIPVPTVIHTASFTADVFPSFFVCSLGLVFWDFCCDDLVDACWSFKNTPNIPIVPPRPSDVRLSVAQERNRRSFVEGEEIPVVALGVRSLKFFFCAMCTVLCSVWECRVICFASSQDICSPGHTLVTRLRVEEHGRLSVFTCR